MHPPFTSCQVVFSHPFMPLYVNLHHFKNYHGFFLYFSTFQLVPFYYIIFPNLVNIFLHLARHLDLHPVSIKHALPISAIKLSSNTTRNIHSTITFASLSSKVLQPASPLISLFLTFSTSQRYLSISSCLISKSSHYF